MARINIHSGQLPRLCFCIYMSSECTATLSLALFSSRELILLQMFSILNEISDNSPRNTTSVIFSSIGSAASVYILVALTGYLSFGDKVRGNIVSMCKFSEI